MNASRRIHNRAFLMVAAALFTVGIGAIFSPLAAQQITPTPAMGTAPTARWGYNDRAINSMQQRIAADPKDYVAFTRLGAAYLQKARETNDPAYYGTAGSALEKALAISPGDYDALTARGSLQLSLHDFDGALETGRKAQQLVPDRAAAYGVVADALNDSIFKPSSTSRPRSLPPTATRARTSPRSSARRPKPARRSSTPRARPSWATRR
jgi:cytochrome c-type biogenesis protein CcmH/NrfG